MRTLNFRACTNKGKKGIALALLIRKVSMRGALFSVPALFTRKWLSYDGCHRLLNPPGLVCRCAGVLDATIISLPSFLKAVRYLR